MGISSLLVWRPGSEIQVGQGHTPSGAPQEGPSHLFQLQGAPDVPRPGHIPPVSAPSSCGLSSVSVS